MSTQLKSKNIEIKLYKILVPAPMHFYCIKNKVNIQNALIETLECEGYLTLRNHVVSLFNEYQKVIVTKKLNLYIKKNIIQNIRKKHSDLLGITNDNLNQIDTQEFSYALFFYISSQKDYISPTQKIYELVQLIKNSK